MTVNGRRHGRRRPGPARRRREPQRPAGQDRQGRRRGLGQAGKRIEFESELDLTDPANLAAARAFIDGVNPATGGPVDLGEATQDLYDRFDADAATNVRLYDVDKMEAGIDIDGSVLGFSAKYSQSDADLTDAWFDPGPGGFQPWFDCSGAVHEATCWRSDCSRRSPAAAAPSPPRGPSRPPASRATTRAGISLRPSGRLDARRARRRASSEFYGTPGEGGLPPQVAVGGATARNDLDDVVTLHKDMQKIRFPSYRVTEDRAVSTRRRRRRRTWSTPSTRCHKPGSGQGPAARGQPAGPDRGRAPARLLRALARRRLRRREARRDLRLLPPAMTRAFWLGLRPRPSRSSSCCSSPRA